MPPKRRVPGHRRERSRRDDQLRHLAAVDPRRYAQLVELRQLNPASFRKELARLVRIRVIPGGRGYEAHPELLEILGRPLGAVIQTLTAGIGDGAIGFREIGALMQEERSGLSRTALLTWLGEQQEMLLDADNRSAEPAIDNPSSRRR